MSAGARALDAATQIARAAENLSARFAAQLARVLRDMERQLRPVLQAAEAGSATAVVKAARANRTRREIRAVLERAGFADLAEAATGRALDGIVNEVLAARVELDLPSTLDTSAALQVQALKALQGADLLDEGETLARALWQATIRGVFASRPVEAILADLGDVLDGTEAQLRTVYDTSLSIFGRQVEALQAGDDPETVFVYMGPADTKTRPFCREHVGKVYTRATIDTLQNGQLDNVFLTGGGYNCRHVWQEVSKLSALRELVGTDQRVSEVESQLRRMPMKKAA